jgi:vanillate/3-O-methylgallate O-demethylase
VSIADLSQAKQFVPVAADGNIVTDGILLRTGEHEYILSGVSAAQEWVKYHAGAGGYDVTYVTDPQSLFRGGANPRLFRYQVQARSRPTWRPGCSAARCR